MKNKLKVLHIVGGDLNAGAARGAYWLYLGLNRLGVDSKIYTNSKNTFSDDNIFTINKSKIENFLCFFRGWLEKIIPKIYGVKGNFSTGCFGKDFTKSKLYNDADIIHLHWINDGLVNIKHLRKINKPIVWTLRDIWPISSGCHVDYYNCNCCKTGSKCKYLNIKSKFDISKYFFNRKKKYYPKHMKIIGISNWLSEKARNSKIFCEYDVRTIHNNINIDDFYSVKKSTSKKVFGINSDKKIILCGSTNLENAWKGLNEYQDAISKLDKEKYLLCFFGNFKKIPDSFLEYEHFNFGFLDDNTSLRNAYNCADVFVAPSIVEPFGKTIIESMACETPIVCFDATGPKDIITHMHDGYKAKPFDSYDLAKGIEWVCNNRNYNALCLNARDKVLKKFDSNVIAKKYIDLYDELIN